MDTDDYLFSRLGLTANDVRGMMTHETFHDGAYPQLTIDTSSSVPDGVTVVKSTKFSAAGLMNLENIEYLHDFVTAAEASMNGARLERVTRIVNGVERQYVKVFGSFNEVIDLDGRWYRLSSPAVAKYFSWSEAAKDALNIRGAGGVTTTLIVAQDLLEAMERGDDITSRDFMTDVGLDVAVGLGSGAAGAAVGAYLGGLLGTAIPVVGTGIGILAGAGIGYGADLLIEKFKVKEFLLSSEFDVAFPQG